jgi:hypothetical protein
MRFSLIPQVVQTLMENARMLHEQGLSLEAIAAEVHATPEQVQDWLRELQSAADESMTIYEEQFRKHCAKCGGDIPTGTTYTEAGGIAYHPDCYRANLKASVALHYAHYNFVRVHRTLRCTPAMAAGVSDRLWSVAELIEAENREVGTQKQ